MHKLWSTSDPNFMRKWLQIHFSFGCFRNPRTTRPDTMAVEAMQKMESPPSPVQFLPVINDENVLIGIVTLHGLVSAGL